MSEATYQHRVVITRDEAVEIADNPVHSEFMEHRRWYLVFRRIGMHPVHGLVAIVEHVPATECQEIDPFPSETPDGVKVVLVEEVWVEHVEYLPRVSGK